MELVYEYEYGILPLEICSYKLVVVFSLAQHVFKTTVEPKRGQPRDFVVRNLQLETRCRHLFGTRHL